MSKNKARTQLPPERLLDGVPHHNRALEVEAKPNGAVLWSSIRRRWWMRAPFNWIMPYRDRKGFHLDSLGLEVWRDCDGRRTVEAIVERFAARHRVSFHEARIAVMQFIQIMTKRELIAVVFNDSGEPGK